jgi:hypothetical protein
MDERPNEYEEANDRATEMKSMTECLKFLHGKGFTEQFKVEDKLLKTVSEGGEYRPEQVTAMNFYRFEGNSDPEDTSILYAIETVDGRKGTLVDAYGVYANPDVDEFVKVMEIHKKVTSH